MMKVLTFYFLLSGFCSFLFISSAFSQEPDPQISVQFHDAGVAYKAKDYKKAIELYNGIIKTGLASGPVYYNLGNSYLKSNQWGEAILNYERARRLMPRDADLASNDRYALSQIKNDQGAQKEPWANRLLNPYADFFTLDEMTVILFVCFFLTGMVYFLGLFLKWPASNYTVSIIILCLVLFLNGFIFAYKVGRQKNQAVILKMTPAKFEPLKDATTYFELNPGGRVKILKQESEWMKVRRLDGKEGWVKEDALQKI